MVIVGISRPRRLPARGFPIPVFPDESAFDRARLTAQLHSCELRGEVSYPFLTFLHTEAFPIPSRRNPVLPWLSFPPAMPEDAIPTISRMCFCPLLLLLIPREGASIRSGSGSMASSVANHGATHYQS